ncbi:hypothetical protein GOBAR_AA04794 [Gossypium barbadense]|uniref:Uncharacterized protein n=1 Tax=Gossypium barbadense TaxID=3634 RepID=A0A2P5YJP9_GOSBA|nr:hypothetical protein GOBAR_AA04794 [Gossypium barbadense]
MKLHSFTLVEFLQKEGGRENINLLTAPTNHRVVVDTGINHNSGENLSETDSISCELNEAMDIGSLISGTSKKRKTIVEVVRISCASEEEGSSAQLERRTPTSPMASPPPVIFARSPIALNKDTPPSAPCIFLFLPTIEEALVEGDGSLFPWHEKLSTKDYPYNLNGVAHKW